MWVSLWGFEEETRILTITLVFLIQTFFDKADDLSVARYLAKFQPKSSQILATHMADLAGMSVISGPL